MFIYGSGIHFQKVIGMQREPSSKTRTDMPNEEGVTEVYRLDRYCRNDEGDTIVYHIYVRKNRRLPDGYLKIK